MGLIAIMNVPSLSARASGPDKEPSKLCKEILAAASSEHLKDRDIQDLIVPLYPLKFKAMVRIYLDRREQQELEVLDFPHVSVVSGNKVQSITFRPEKAEFSIKLGHLQAAGHKVTSSSLVYVDPLLDDIQKALDLILSPDRQNPPFGSEIHPDIYYALSTSYIERVLSLHEYGKENHKLSPERYDKSLNDKWRGISFHPTTGPEDVVFSFINIKLNLENDELREQLTVRDFQALVSLLENALHGEDAVRQALEN